ncbi:recombinase family protein [Anaerospora sp.]|uniref:recombinase family protein n=1 Tax=Anaerospora sp. TaxID=1960278 RepID=UPI00289DEE31|nr:recombinase family protein [Anaerospora sp.]
MQHDSTLSVIKVAIYVRVSTEEQAEHGYSIDAQLNTLRDYCRLYNKEVFHEYVDRGISGKEMTRREQLQRLLKDAEQGLFQEVIVWKFNRMSRKNKDLLEIVDWLEKHNVHFRSFSENFDTSTPMGRFALQMMGAVGELERNTIVENVKLGMKQRAREGFFNGGSCLGYESVKPTETDRNTLRIVPAEAPTVRKIFSLYAAGKGLRSIANQLNREGHRTNKGNTFGSDSIRQIITNPIYIGHIRYNRFEDWSEKRRKGKTSEAIIVEGKHEAIIDQGLWDKVQRLFQQKSKVSPRQQQSENLLTGLIRCPECNTPMVASRTVNYLKDGTKVTRRYYSCGQFRSKGSSVCHANSVKAEEAENYVLKRVKRVLNHPQLLADITKAANDKLINNQESLRLELPAIVAKLEQLADKKRKILDVYELEDLDRETLGKRLREITAEEHSLSLRKSEIEAGLRQEVREVPETLLRSLLMRFDLLLEQAPVEQKKMLLLMAVKEITLTEKKKIDKIILRFESDIGNDYLEQVPFAITKANGAFSIHRKRLLLAI